MPPGAGVVQLRWLRGILSSGESHCVHAAAPKMPLERWSFSMRGCYGHSQWVDVWAVSMGHHPSGVCNPSRTSAFICSHFS